MPLVIDLRTRHQIDLAILEARAHPGKPEQVLIPVGYRVAISFDSRTIHLAISMVQGNRPSEGAVGLIAQTFGIAYPGDEMWVEESTIHIIANQLMR